MQQVKREVIPNIFQLDVVEAPKAQTDRVVVIIPAYNEERFIGSVVLKSREYADFVVVVDDGSSDNTARIAEMAGAVVVKHEKNSGKATAMNTAFAKALELNPSAVIAMDGDWQHEPDEILKVAAPVLAGEADLVVGSRYLENTSDVPLKRIIGHRGLTTTINALSGVNVTDSQSGFRAFSADAARVMNFSSAGFTIESEMQFIAKEHNLSVAEVPITIRYMDAPKRSVVSQGMQVLNGVLRLVAQHRPLLFFSGIGMATMILAAMIGGIALTHYNISQELPLGVTMISVMLGLLGAIAIFTGIILHTLRSIVVDYLKQ
jgi:glycosyltransferase involved in cell wall biosynthesis